MTRNRKEPKEPPHSGDTPNAKRHKDRNDLTTEDMDTTRRQLELGTVETNEEAPRKVEATEEDNPEMEQDYLRKQGVCRQSTGEPRRTQVMLEEDKTQTEQACLS